VLHYYINDLHSSHIQKSDNILYMLKQRKSSVYLICMIGPGMIKAIAIFISHRSRLQVDDAVIVTLI